MLAGAAWALHGCWLSAAYALLGRCLGAACGAAIARSRAPRARQFGPVPFTGAGNPVSGQNS
eukprot:11219188-Lingulodinium_polyedra.AAC.1